MGLIFMLTETYSIQIALFAYARFASNADMSSDLRYIVTKMGKHSNEHIVPYSIIEFKWVKQIIVDIKLCAVIRAFDYTSTVLVNLIQSLKRSMPLAVFTDSKTYCNVKLPSITKRRKDFSLT